MGYISFNKGGGDVDLIPAENIVHVSAADADNIQISYGVGLGTSPAVMTADVVYATASAAQYATVRGLVNAAIEKANGASGPAIPVGLPTLVTAVHIKSVDVSS